MARTLVLLIAAALNSAPIWSPVALAQDAYPNRNITLVVGFAAGGTSDIIARLLGQKITEYTGANVVIENIPGAASMTATEKVALG